ncbi:MAG: hypothetical protein HQK49_15230 [Oligoflexia bacterium]|nr:hypothetical protein [Oligoflexia bacterium]
MFKNVSKYFFTIIFLSQFLFSANVDAKIFTITKNGDFKLRKNVIKEILLDYENYCNQGCKYKLTGIESIKKVEVVDANHMFIWTYVDNIKQYKYFSYIEVVANDLNKVTIINTYPSWEEVDRLISSYQLSHSTPFVSGETIWTIEEKFDSQGNWSHTNVDYFSSFYASFLISIFGKKINQNLEITANDLFQDMSIAQ